MEGWIKLHRNLIKWEWYNDSKTVHLFVHLLLSANHEDGSWRGQNIKRGQLITGLNKLNADTGISAQSLRTCLKRLKSTNEITIKSTNKYSLITILNYDLYQNNELENQATNKQLTNNQQATNKQLTTNNNNKNNKEYNISPKPKKVYDEKYVSFSKRFYELLKSNDMISKNQNYKSKTWLKEIEALELIDGVSWENIQIGTKYYFDILADDRIDKAYIPVIKSPKALRDKWEKLRDHLRRNQNK